jgi:hypothetical protein
MATKFLDGLGDNLEKAWVAVLLTPAFLFWAGGFVSATDCHHWWAWRIVTRWVRGPVASRVGTCDSWTLARGAAWIAGRDTVSLLVLAGAVVVLVAVSSVVAQAFLPMWCRWTQGWWPGPAYPAATWRALKKHRVARSHAVEWGTVGKTMRGALPERRGESNAW